jgi:hypothetical protein
VSDGFVIYHYLSPSTIIYLVLNNSNQIPKEKPLPNHPQVVIEPVRVWLE